MQKTKILFTTMLAVLSTSAFSDNVQQFARYKLDAKASNDSYVYSDSDKVVAETKTHVVVRQDAGNSCAAGNFFLMNKTSKTYQAVSAGTCDDRDFSVKLTNNRLSFKQNKNITALYPIY